MPQKKNPDVPELVRGKTGPRRRQPRRRCSMLMKGQPLAYNKDNQEDKEPLFDTVDTLADTLAIMTDLVASGITVDAARMRDAAREGFATATDLADYLVSKGLPFRDAHEAVARAVRHAEAQGVDLADLPLAELRQFAPAVGDDVFATSDAGGFRRQPRPSRRHGARAGACRDRRRARRARGADAGGLPQDALGFAAGMLTTIAFVPRSADRQTRSAHDISWWMFGIFSVGIALWLWYGMRPCACR